MAKRIQAPKVLRSLRITQYANCGPCIAVFTDESESVWEILQERRQDVGENFAKRQILIFQSPREALEHIKDLVPPIMNNEDGKGDPGAIKLMIFPVRHFHLTEFLCKPDGTIWRRDTRPHKFDDCENDDCCICAPCRKL